MQAAGDLHHEIGNACFGQAQNVFDNAAPFDTSDRMFDDDPGAGDERVEKLVADAQLFAFGLFFGCVLSDAAGS